VQDARGDEAQDRLAPAITSVCPALWPALEAHDARTVVRQPVDDLALALVAPLRADDDYVTSHFPSFFVSIRRIRALRGRLHARAVDDDDSPDARSFSMPRRARVVIAGARIARAAGGAGASAASCRKSMVNPVRGRARPNVAPTSS
jgi:hypothetical protein